MMKRSVDLALFTGKSYTFMTSIAIEGLSLLLTIINDNDMTLIKTYISHFFSNCFRYSPGEVPKPFLNSRLNRL